MGLDKNTVLEELKTLWRSSETMTYKGLEKVQEARYGTIYFKDTTLRNRASKEGWNQERGADLLTAVEVAQDNFIQDNQGVLTPELLQRMDEEERYLTLEKMLLVKYSPQFDNIKAKQSELILNGDHSDKEVQRQIKAYGEIMEEIIRTQEREKKLLGMMDKKDFMKLEIEKLKLELLVSSKVNKELKEQGGD